MNKKNHPAIPARGLERYVPSSGRPYLIADEGPDGDYTSDDVLQLISRHFNEIRNRAYDLAGSKALARGASNERFLQSFRNLVKAETDAARELGRAAFHIGEPLYVVDLAKSTSDDDDDPALTEMVRILLDRGDDVDALRSSHRTDLSPLGHVTYCLGAYDALMDAFEQHLILLFTEVLEDHFAVEHLPRLLHRQIQLGRAELRQDLRRNGLPA